jgi:hypothetical protein
MNIENLKLVELNLEELKLIEGGGWIDRILRAIEIYDAISDFRDGWNSVKCP